MFFHERLLSRLGLVVRENLVLIVDNGLAYLHSLSDNLCHDWLLSMSLGTTGLSSYLLV
jgi:hypothetical protein